MADFDNNEQTGDIFSKAVRAGKRTYFFDVRSTRSNDYYLTITESKKRFTEGVEKPFYEKHKIFLYKEDFEKFMEGIQEAIEHININRPERVERSIQSNHTGHSNGTDEPVSKGFSDVNFDDLGNP